MADTSSSFEFAGVLAHSEGILKFVLLLLVAASVVVWIVWVAKALQLRRLAGQQKSVEKAANTTEDVSELLGLGRNMAGPGARVLSALSNRVQDEALTVDILQATAERQVTEESKQYLSLMALLSSIASSTPFIGLFGTVYGIMQAFRLIGLQKSASLPVVAPAIGEALIATAIGLMAAIPATIAYNFLDRRASDLEAELTSASNLWVQRIFAAEMHGRSGAKG